MYGPNYAWIIFGEFAPNKMFQMEDKENTPCTVDELKQAVDRYISTVKLDIRQDDKETFSGMVCSGIGLVGLLILYFRLVNHEDLKENIRTDAFL